MAIEPYYMKTNLIKSISTFIGLVCFLLIFYGNAYADNDALYKKWLNKSLSAEERLQANQEFTRAILYSYPDSSRSLAAQALELALEKKLIAFQIDAHTTIGGAYWVQLEYINALNHYLSSLDLAKESGSKIQIANAYNNIGTVYDELGDYPKALENYQKSLSIKLDENHESGLAVSYSNIGSIYHIMGKHNEALDFFNKSLTIDQKLNNKSGIAQSYNNLGMVYGQLGKSDKAESFYLQSLNLNKELNDTRGIANALNNLGSLYDNLNNHNKALEYFKECLSLQEKSDDKRGMAVSQTNIGNSYIAKKQYDEAIKWCEKSYLLSEKQKLTQQQHSACECLYLSHKRKKNEGYALAYLERLLTLNDQLAADQTNDMLQQLKMNNQLQIQQINFKNAQETDSIRKAQEQLKIELKHQQEVKRTNNIRNIALVSGLIVLIIAGGLFAQLKVVRRSRKLIEKEKDRSDKLLLNILPEEIAKELKEKGHADAKNHDKVTILFTDFKEFTQTSEKLSARELVQEINACFEAFDKIMEKYNIEKIKTIGDAYMAAGGLPVPESASVQNTVRAALDMQAFITSRKKESDQEGHVAFEMRVGIHTGPAVAGIVGVKKFQYDIWGDTVNTASRMESSGEVGRVNISHDTYEVIKDDPMFTFESRGKIEAKHKGAIDMYFVSYA